MPETTGETGLVNHIKWLGEQMVENGIDTVQGHLKTVMDGVGIYDAADKYDFYLERNRKGNPDDDIWLARIAAGGTTFTEYVFKGRVGAGLGKWTWGKIFKPHMSGIEAMQSGALATGVSSAYYGYIDLVDQTALETNDGLYDFMRYIQDKFQGNEPLNTYILDRQMKAAERMVLRMSRDSDAASHELVCDIDEFNQIVNPVVKTTDSTINSEKSALDFSKALKDEELSPYFVPFPKLKPNTPIIVEGANGVQEEFELVEGDPNDILRDNLGTHGALNLDDVAIAITNDGKKIAVIGKNAILVIQDPILGQLEIPAQAFFQMLGQRVEAFTQFVSSVVENAVINVGQQNSIFIAKIVAGLLEGRDIEDIAEEMAVQAVAAGVVDKLIAELGDTDIFSSLRDLNGQSTLGVDAIKGAITAVAVTAILNGRDAGLEDYARAAATASVQRVVNRGVDTFFQQKGVTDVVGKGTTLHAASNAGVAAALVSLAASLISGVGINEDTLRAAAAAGAIAAATSTIVGFMELGAAAGPVGVVIGAVLGVVVGNLFKHGGEKVYHNETIGHVKEKKPDGTGEIIIGVREAGALLRAGITADDIVGTNGDDVLVGNDQKNVLVANGGDDMLEGRGGDDVLLAGAGDDYVEAGDGDDYAEGNDGHDKILGEAGNDMILGGPGNDILSGGKGDDQVEGDTGDDQIAGDSGNDVILGGEGDDAIHGGAGVDVLDGGPGNDNIDGSLGNDEVHGGDGDDQLFGGRGDDLVRGGAGDDIAYGDEGRDMLYGDLGHDILDGGEGPDLLFGGIGRDNLFGQEGNDHLHGELDDDYLVGGKGNDLLVGGPGNDVYVFGRGDGTDTIDDSIGTRDIAWLANYVIEEITFTKDGDNLIIDAPSLTSDRLTILNQFKDNNIELLVFSNGRAIDLTSLQIDENGVVTFIMSTDDPTALLTQTNFPGTWQEAEEDRSYMTHNPASTFYHQNFDTMVITDPLEMALYNDVQVRANVVKKRSWHGRTRVIIHYYDYIETFLVGTPGADRIVGNFASETINGLEGNDQLYGNSGVDTIDGGPDHDKVLGGPQNDVLNGGDGHDKMYGGPGDDTIEGGSGNDALLGEWGSDTIRGGEGDDLVVGGVGNDHLSGDGGHDTLIGGPGSDTLYGNGGNDFVLGGEGSDHLDGGSGEDYLEGGDGTDTLVGGSGRDVLRGEDGVDNLQGGDDDDLLIGGQEGDTLNGGSGVDTASYAESDEGVVINLQTGSASGGHATGDTLTSIENVIGTDYNDQLVGNSEDNTLVGGYGNDDLQGGAGDDELQGGAGSDHLDGGEGFDKVSYADSASGVTIDFEAGTGQFGHAEGDTFVNMEHVVGSRFDDSLIVGNSSVTFEAGEGYDTIVLPGLAAAYEIILDRTVLTARHKTSGKLHTFPDGERLEFDDIAYGLEDFPGDGDAKAIIPTNKAAVGVILRDARDETIVIESSGAGATSLNSDGTFTYLPPTDYIGSDTFGIRITDPVTKLIRIQNVDVQVNVDGRTPERVMESITNIHIYDGDVIRFDDGSIVIAWLKAIWRPDPPPYGVEGEREYQIKLQSFDRNLNKIGSAKVIASVKAYITNNTTSVTGEHLSGPKLAALRNGRLSLAWGHGIFGSSASSVKQQILTATGSAISSIQTISPSDAESNHPNLVSLNDGGYVLSFQSCHCNNDAALYVQKYNSSQNKIREYLLDTGRTDNNPVHHKISEYSNGSLLVTWLFQDSGTIRNVATIISPDGSQSERLELSPNIGVREMSPYYSDVTILSDELLAVAFVANYRHNYDGVVQVFKTSGKLVAEHVFINSQNAGRTPEYLKIMTDGNNHFLVTWVQELDSSSNKELYSQLFDYQGSVMGDRITVSEPESGGAQYPFAFEITSGNMDFIYTAADKVVSKRMNLNAVLTGSIGNDVLIGDSRQNVLEGREGADVLDGAGDIDTVSYRDSSDGVHVNLSDTHHTDAAGEVYINGISSDAEGDQIRNIENIIGSSHDDTFSGGTESNVIDGGKGMDSVHYKGLFSGYTVQMREADVFVKDNDALDGDDGLDRLVNIERFEFADRKFDLNAFPDAEDSIVRVLENGSARGVLGDANHLSFTLDSQANHGDVTINSDGSYTYIPNADYLGADTFSYWVTNAEGLGRLVEVSIEVANDIEIAAITRSSFPVNEATDGNQGSSPSIRTLPGNSVLATWGKSGGQYGGVFARMFNRQGFAYTHDFKIDYLDNGGGASASDSVALDDGDFVVVWGDGFGSRYHDGSHNGIFSQKFDVKGRPIGDFFQINTEFKDDQRYPQGALLSDSNIVVIWTSQTTASPYWQGDVRGRIITPDGVPFSSEFYVDGGRISLGPRVMALKNGGFVVIYDKLNDGSGYGVFMKKFTDNGTSVGNRITVNTTTQWDQRAPSLYQTEDNNIVAVWIDFGYQSIDGSGYTYGTDNANVVVQVFDIKLNRVGSEIIINDQPFSATNRNWGETLFNSVDVTSLGNTLSLVSWSQGNDVKGRVVDNQFNRVGPEHILSDGSANVYKHGISSVGDGRVALIRRDYSDKYGDFCNLHFIDIGYPALVGTPGNDVLQSGDGDDVLQGEGGDNIYHTGLGADTIVLSINPNATEVIADFDFRHDKIDLTAYDFMLNGFSDLQRHMRQEETDVIIELDNGHTVVVQNTFLQHLTPERFIGTASGNSLPVAHLRSMVVPKNETVIVDVVAHTTDLDNDTLSLVGITEPSQGNSTFTNSSLAYTSRPGYSGLDELDYTIRDEQGGETTQTLTLAVAPPTAPERIEFDDNSDALPDDNSDALPDDNSDGLPNEGSGEQTGSNANTSDEKSQTQTSGASRNSLFWSMPLMMVWRMSQSVNDYLFTPSDLEPSGAEYNVPDEADTFKTTTKWQVETHKDEVAKAYHYKKLSIVENANLPTALCTDDICGEKCEVTVDLPTNDRATYALEEVSTAGNVDGYIKDISHCSAEDINWVVEDTQQRLQDERQQQAEQEQLVSSLSQVSMESAGTTGLVLLVRDVMLVQGYSPSAASWGSYTVSQGISLARVGRSLCQGVDYLTATLPLVASTVFFHGLTKTNIVTERTATWCSRAASVSASYYTGAGFFQAAGASGVAGFVSFLTSLGERKLADKYLTSNLAKRCEDLRELRSELKGYYEEDRRWCDLDRKIQAALTKAEVKPTMKEYEVIHQYQEHLEKCLAECGVAADSHAYHSRDCNTAQNRFF